MNYSILHLADTPSIAPEWLVNPTHLLPIRHSLANLRFNDVYDMLVTMVDELSQQQRLDEAIAAIRKFDEMVRRLSGDKEGLMQLLDASVLQILTSILRQQGDIKGAKECAAAALTLLAQEPKRKDEAFLAVLALLLYDTALLHVEEGEFKQAEREIEKSMSLFERLARNNSQRYGAAHLMAMNASTQIYRSRIKQVNMLAQYQEASSSYLQQLNEGIEGAAMKLVDSLTEEGDTLIKMGRRREAIQYFMRALKYLTNISPEFTLQQLRLSIRLGEALLYVKTSRDKGIHLLNTMLHKATKINAEQEHRMIVDILFNARNGRMDILSLWHKIFPR